ncbi:MAG: glycosyltransferase family 2 protein [Planctomycetota bacterium]|nr:glycosyltransferase family 2 protein [Planctomycetota bacterium]
MCKSQPLLTISVITWNRCRFLQDFLASVDTQSCEIDPREVEVVVSDNASEDATPEVVADFKRTSTLPVQYFRNETNVGSVKNMLLALQRSTGRFWMFYGDDDLVPAGRLKQIISLLAQHRDQPAVLFQGEGDSPPVPNVTQPTAITLTEAARSYFYPFGNPGRFAVRTDLALTAMDELPEVATITWPQTAIGFTAMWVSSNAKPLLLAPFPGGASPNHSRNTIYTMSYVWCTMYRDLLHCAWMVRQRIGNREIRQNVYDAACFHLFSWSRIKSLTIQLLIYSLIEDQPAVRRVRGSVRRTVRRLPLRLLPYGMIPWIVLLLPKWFRFGVAWLAQRMHWLVSGSSLRVSLRQRIATAKAELLSAGNGRKDERRFSIDEEELWRTEC